MAKNEALFEDKKYLRLIDANLNRAREGLRVVEDTARFVLNRPEIYKNARGIRHKLDTATRSVYPELVAQRDSEKDSGRKIKEGKRPGLSAVVSANFRRVEESLRVLEEYSKLISPSAGAVFKKARFNAYILEKKLLKTAKDK